MSAFISPFVTSIGLICDIVGALLVANEVVRIFKGPATIDVGDAGCFNGSTNIVSNPQFEEHERRKRKIMKWGLSFLLVGFILQGVGTWLSLLYTAK